MNPLQKRALGYCAAVDFVKLKNSSRAVNCKLELNLREWTQEKIEDKNTKRAGSSGEKART